MALAPSERTLARVKTQFSLARAPVFFTAHSTIPGQLFSTNCLDVWFLLHDRSAAALGVYSLACQLAGTAMQLSVLAGSLLLPLVSHGRSIVAV